MQMWGMMNLERCLKISKESDGGYDEVNYFDNVFTDIGSLLDGINRKTRRKYKIEYYDIPCCFDIETSSFIDADGDKSGCMYIWMFSIDDHIIIGRSWDEFMELIKQLKDKLSLHPKFRRLICYVQNLGYEFQWFCKRIKWEKVFALDTRIPLTALSCDGIEFRCSYRLSGYSLQKMGESLQKYTVQKQVGDLDYSKIRLPADPETGFAGTALTDAELGYCINDVRVLSAYIRETMEHDGGITKIPLTKTGYVRQYCREHIYGGKSHNANDYLHYRQFIQNLTLDPEEFKMLQAAFMGGYTHASTFYSNKKEPVTDVTSYDYTSKYPSALVAEKYPMSKGEFYKPKDTKDLKYQLSHYCCVFEIRFTNIRSIIPYENYISESKCRLEKPVLNNGRVVSAATLYTTITNVDFDIMKKCYIWDKVAIGRFIRYEKKYLPTDFINCVLDFYEKKTTLKGVGGDTEIDYQLFKGMLNACYGMAVTNPCKPIITYVSGETDDIDTEDLGWITREQILSEQINKYNNDKQRFLFYPWGIFCTAYCRRDIWFHGILKCGKDYLYSDTDSVKFIGQHEDFVKEYNREILKKLISACKYHKIDISRIAPKNIKGEIKPLGVFDFDGHYSRFSTLGAKRYLMQYSDDDRNPEKKRGKYMLTVAGLNKKKGAEYLKTFKDPFKVFNKDLVVPKEYSGRQAATYIDYEVSGTITDYLGHTGNYHELSLLHLEETEYNMNIIDSYLDYVFGVQEKYEI